MVSPEKNLIVAIYNAQKLSKDLRFKSMIFNLCGVKSSHNNQRRIKSVYYPKSSTLFTQETQSLLQANNISAKHTLKLYVSYIARPENPKTCLGNINEQS